MTTTYALSPRPHGRGYDIHVISSEGVHQTMLDFKTEAEAEAWIASDKERDRNVADSRVMAPFHQV
jgi:hypothetical protein